ncbi:MAG TPA: hypothetical protein VLZ06_06450 [Solirubrobacteraceae bacterium]|nr:hypothetical protein [Solirubrobacteraceae bacterium]
MKRLIALGVGVLLAFAVTPALAWGMGTEKTIMVFSEASNSLCVNPTYFPNPAVEYFKPLEPPTTGPFHEEPPYCASTPTHPITEGGLAGGPSGFKYGANPLYGASIAGGTWVSPYPGAKSSHVPAYYVYDAEFEIPCTPEAAAMKGQFLADNAAAAYLNGKWLAHDELNNSPTAKNFVMPTAFAGVPGPGLNILQFVVLDQTEPYTGLDFKAIIKYKCKEIRWEKVGTEKEQTISWGKLTFTTPVGPVTCKKSDAGNIWNPKKGNGLDETVLFDLYECSAEECPKGVEVTASGLPWNTELEEVSGVIRDKMTGVALSVDCEGRVFNFAGELTPKVVKATKKTPGIDEFDAGSGGLQSTEGTGFELKVAGKDNMAGFLNLEPIGATSTSIKPSKEEKTAEKAVLKEEKVDEARNKKEAPRLEKEGEERGE